MAKPTRIHAPGCIFHITARTQGHEPWFTPAIRSRVVCEIVNAASASVIRVLAFAIMPNHFHIILRQGSAPLSYMMHRVMHRCALILKRAHSLQGHVFERRYWSGLCPTPDYVRRAIIYTHLNPWRANLCSDPAEYQWSSHTLYVLTTEDRARMDSAVSASDGLRLFAKSQSLDEAVRQYEDMVRFQMAVDTFLSGSTPAAMLAAPSNCEAGDAHWIDEYGPHVKLFGSTSPVRSIYDVASKILVQIDRRCSLDTVRTNSRVRHVAAVRRKLTLALSSYGFGTVEIARFLGLSPSTVSMIKAALRN